MRFFLLFMILFFLLNHLHLSASESGEIDGVYFEFNHADDCYSFRGSFIVKAELDCLIRILYNFKHLKNIISDASSIILIQQGGNWYDVCYTFKKFLFTNQSVYRKTLKLEEQKIVFKMISYKHNINLFPKVLSSSGHYRINADSTGYVIEYYQECKIASSFIKNIYIDKAKKESTNFMLGLKEYIENTCH